MLLGAILQHLQEEPGAATALQTIGDAALLAELRDMGAHFGETPAEYAINATRRYAASATDDDWLALMTALERGDDPARICLDRMLRWALRRDASEIARATSAGRETKQMQCGCGGAHGRL